jgi:hypothetical protein
MPYTRADVVVDQVEVGPAEHVDRRSTDPLVRNEVGVGNTASGQRRECLSGAPRFLDQRMSLKTPTPPYMWLTQRLPASRRISRSRARSGHLFPIS